MTEASSILVGTAGAPLAATREYTFQRIGPSAGEERLRIPYVQRGSWDDFGIVERAEQEVFVVRLFKSLGVTVRSGYPGEWIVPDATELEAVWAALTAQLQPRALAVPVANAGRTVSAAEARAVDGELTQRFLSLVSVVAGLTEGAFECRDRRIDTGQETTRLEHWTRGEIQVRLDATGIEDGYGIHGEESALKIVSLLGDGRDASLSSRIDLRSGGTLSVRVCGVLDAQALVDAFVRP